jgi:hypothetical protein
MRQLSGVAFVVALWGCGSSTTLAPAGGIRDLPHRDDLAGFDACERRHVDIHPGAGRGDPEERAGVDAGDADASGRQAAGRDDVSDGVQQIAEAVACHGSECRRDAVLPFCHVAPAASRRGGHRAARFHGSSRRG